MYWQTFSRELLSMEIHVVSSNLIGYKKRTFVSDKEALTEEDHEQSTISQKFNIFDTAEFYL